MERSRLWLTAEEVSHATSEMGCQTKARIVIQGLQGRPVADICHEYQISQSLYDQWHEQFLAHAANAVEVHQHTRKEARLERENAVLKKLVGELALE